MPISLLEHIIPVSSCGSSHGCMMPSGDMNGIVQNFHVIPSQAFPPGGLAFNDAVPTAGFLCNTEGAVEFTSGTKQNTFKAGWISGQYLEQVHIRFVRPGEYLMLVRFNPVNFHAAYGVPPGFLRKTALALGDVFGPDVPGLLDRLSKEEAVETKTKLIGQFLIERARPVGYTNYKLQEAITMIETSRGCMPIDHLSENLNVGYKWLERNFLLHLGLSPKEYSRQQRFIHTYFDLLSQSGKDPAAVAIRNGYYDQNHFSKEFKKFTGSTPVDYCKSIGRVSIYTVSTQDLSS